MENSDFKITNIDIEEIVLQAKKIVGLAQVFEIFFASEEGDFLSCAFEYLSDEALKHHNECYALMQKLCDNEQ